MEPVELIQGKLMHLDCSRRSYMAMLITEWKRVLFYCEIVKNNFPPNIDQKDFAKMNTLMAVSCIRLVKFLASKEPIH